MKAVWDSVELIRNYSGFFCVRLPEKALDLQQTTAKPWYTESKFWITRSLILNANRVPNAGKIKMAKSTVEKQAEFGEIKMDGAILLSSVWKQEMTHNEFLGCYFPGQEKFILIDSNTSFYIYGEK